MKKDKKNNELRQAQLIMEFFMRNPGRPIKHPEVVDWCVAEYKKRTGEVFRDPDRAIRKLSQEGRLIKMGKGIYKYDPALERHRALPDFTLEQKEQIFKRDGYRCVVCGAGKESGIELHADHIKPRDLGGESTLENGQTLCAQHNFQKKNLKQTETGKKMFIRLYDLAKHYDDEKLKRFCAEVLEAYEKHSMNSHIKWKK